MEVGIGQAQPAEQFPHPGRIPRSAEGLIFPEQPVLRFEGFLQLFGIAVNLGQAEARFDGLQLRFEFRYARIARER
jgi:hypothetical protein